MHIGVHCSAVRYIKKISQYFLNIDFIDNIDMHKSLFRTSLGSTMVAEHFIPTTGAPVKVPPQCIPANYRLDVEKQIQTMVKEGIIEECSNPWLAPVVFVCKKTGDIRVCIDYRELNTSQ